MDKKVFIIAGETSGDLHGSALIRELKKLDPDLSFSGIGGDLMINEGLTTLYNLKQFSFLGFTEVVKHLPFITKVRTEVIEYLKKNNIKNLILIDYPGFNLSLAKQLHNSGINIFYYISPQVWAWGKKRVKKIKKYITKVFVIFPFEEKFFKEHGLDVVYVGHPLIERVNNYPFCTKEELYRKYNIPAEKEILLVMPGSRQLEISRIFPSVISGAFKLADKYNMEIVVAVPDNISFDMFTPYSSTHKFILAKEDTYNLLKHAHFGIIKSGTSTLEAALLQLPMVIVYKTSALTYLIGKNLVKLNHIGLANIVSGEEVVPELIQNDVSTTKIFDEGSLILKNKSLYAEIKSKFERISKLLGESGGSWKAAEEIYKRFTF